MRGLLQNYLEDSASDNWATLILWRIRISIRDVRSMVES